MKRLVVVLLATNVATLLGLAVVSTVLVMKQYSSATETAARERESEAEQERRALEQRYLTAVAAAKDEAATAKSRSAEEALAAAEAARREVEARYIKALESAAAERAATAAQLATAEAAAARAQAEAEAEAARKLAASQQAHANAGQPAATAPSDNRDNRPVRIIPPAQPRPAGIQGWVLKMVGYDNSTPPRGVAYVETQDGELHPMVVGQTLRDWRLEAIGQKSALFVAEDGRTRHTLVIDEPEAPVDPMGERTVIGPYDLRQFAPEAVSGNGNANGNPASQPPAPENPLQPAGDNATLSRDGDGGSVQQPEQPEQLPANPDPAGTPDAAGTADSPAPGGAGAQPVPSSDTGNGDGRRMVLPDGREVPLTDAARTASASDDARRSAGQAAMEEAARNVPAGVATRTLQHLLAPEQMYALKTDHRKVLQQALFEGVFDPATASFNGVRLVNFPKNSIWSLYGFQYDDIIESVNNVPVHTGDDIDTLPERCDFSHGAVVRVRRDGEIIIYRFIASPELLAAYEKKLAEQAAARRDLLDAAEAARRNATANQPPVPPADPEKPDTTAGG